MKHLSLLAAALLAPLPLLAAPAELTLDQVLARHYEARGGLDRIKAVQDVRAEGTFTMGPMTAPFTLESKRPNKLRLEFTLQGMTGVQAIDGGNGWQIMPFMGKSDPEPMGEDELRSFSQQADIDGPLVDWQAKGHTVELLGTEEVEGTDAYKLRIDLASGDQITTWLDAEYFLDLKWDVRTTMRGQEVKIGISQGDYKEVDGLMLPHATTQTMDGMPGASTYTVERYVLNTGIADDRFRMPEAATPAADTAAE